MQAYWATSLRNRRGNMIIFECEDINQMICFLNYYYSGEPYDCGILSNNIYEMYTDDNKTDLCTAYLLENYKKRKTYEAPKESLYGCRLLNDNERLKCERKQAKEESKKEIISSTI